MSFFFLPYESGKLHRFKCGEDYITHQKIYQEYFGIFSYRESYNNCNYEVREHFYKINRHIF